MRPLKFRSKASLVLILSVLKEWKVEWTLPNWESSMAVWCAGRCNIELHSFLDLRVLMLARFLIICNCLIYKFIYCLHLELFFYNFVDYKVEQINVILTEHNIIYILIVYWKIKLTNLHWYVYIFQGTLNWF